jgi:hypothetical protein
MRNDFGYGNLADRDGRVMLCAFPAVQQVGARLLIYIGRIYSPLLLHAPHEFFEASSTTSMGSIISRPILYKAGNTE